MTAPHVVRPMMNRDSQFFWDGTRVGELRIQKCNACGAKRFPPGPACQSCPAYDRGYEVAAGTGTVFSYVVHRHPPVPGKELPIVIALIDLEEGVRMVGEVVDVPEGDDGPEIEIGMALRVGFNRIDDDLTLPVWRRA
jgi:3-oxo-4,17-pregnadiene-20-carboxyl-CoA hydratase alpha subunit